MKRNLVLFATGQHIPNLLSVHAALEGGERLDRLVCVASDKYRTTDPAEPKEDERFRAALRLSETTRELADRMEVVQLVKADYEGTCQVLRTVRDVDPHAHWIVNVTGGLKVMAIAAADVFRAAASNELLYLEADSTSQPLVLTGTKQRRWEKPIEHRVTIAEYLQGYGFRIDNEHSLADERERVKTYAELTNWLFDNWEVGWVWETIRALDAWAAKNDEGRPERNKPIPLPSDTGWSVPEPAWRKLMAQVFAGLDENDGRLYGALDKYAHKYLTSGWLEHWTFDTLRLCMPQLPALHDLQTGMRVKSRGVEQGKDVSNEFDVAFMYGTTLWIIECKSGAQDHKQGADDQPMDDALYKLEAIRANLKGLHSRSAIIYTQAEPRDAMKKRARAYGCALIGPQQLRVWHDLRLAENYAQLAATIKTDLFKPQD